MYYSIVPRARVPRMGFPFGGKPVEMWKTRVIAGFSPAPTNPNIYVRTSLLTAYLVVFQRVWSFFLPAGRFFPAVYGIL